MGPDQVDPPACNYGDLTSTRLAVLLGDSHAVAAFTGINAAALADGWHLNSWTKSGCSVANVTKFDTARGRVNVACDTFRTKIFARVIALHPEKVLINNAVPPNLVLVDRQTGAKVTGPKATKMFLAGYRDSVSQLTTAGIEVTVLQDFPRSPVDPPTCLIEKKSISACSFPRPRGISMEAAAVKGIKGARLLDLTDRLCGPTTCSPVVGDVLAYRDAQHITRTFAMTLVHDFERWLPPVGTAQKSATS